MANALQETDSVLYLADGQPSWKHPDCVAPGNTQVHDEPPAAVRHAKGVRSQGVYVDPFDDLNVVNPNLVG